MQEFIAEVGDLLVHMNTISTGLKELELISEKQILVDKIRHFVLGSKDRFYIAFASL